MAERKKAPKVDKIYYALDKDLHIDDGDKGVGHNIIVTSIDKKRKTARVKTITSLEDYDPRAEKWRFRAKTLNDIKFGRIIVIPKKQMKSARLSGVKHKTIVIPWSAVKDTAPDNPMKFPTRYKKLIHRK